jgi:hypothetical protein
MKEGGHVSSYKYPVSYKGSTFYLSEAMFNVWSALELTAIPLMIAAVSLVLACNTFEYRAKRRLWDPELDGLVGQTDSPKTGVD